MFTWRSDIFLGGNFMTTSFALKVFFEIGLVMLIVYGYKNEEKLIDFETELFAVLKFAFKKYVLKTAGRKNAAKTSAAYAGVSKSAPQLQQAVTAGNSDAYKGTGTPATRRVRAEIKAFPVSKASRDVA